MPNFALTCAANSFNSIFPLLLLPAFSSRPIMKSRNGYDAIAIRSRAAPGNCIFGPTSAARTVFSLGDTNAPAAEHAASPKNCRRVFITNLPPSQNT
jgi:hypothetical protein